MNILFYISLILFIGLLFGKLAGYVKLPEVTGFLIAGVLMGPSVLKIIPASVSHSLYLVSEVALGFIAYSIGSEFNFEHMKRVGISVLLITIFEASCATLFVTLIMYFLLHQSLAFSLILGSIAAATSPATTLMVIRQYKAKGPVVDTLLPVVAMDDAACIIIFGICSAIGTTLLSGGDNSILRSLIHPVIEILSAIIIGVILGIIFVYLSKKLNNTEKLLNLTVAFIFISIGICDKFHLSSLLCCIAISTTIANLLPSSTKIFSASNIFTAPIFVIFFTMAGIDLDLSLIAQIGLLGIGYFLGRAFGKLFGAYIGGTLGKAPQTVRKYLGFTLMPQTGVAIGLALIAQSILPKEQGINLNTIILASTIIFDLIGPLATKAAFTKAKEIKNIQ